jgi:hypothetical protein
MLKILQKANLEALSMVFEGRCQNPKLHGHLFVFAIVIITRFALFQPLGTASQ